MRSFPLCWPSPCRIIGLQFLEASLNHSHKQISLIIYCFRAHTKIILFKTGEGAIPWKRRRCQSWVGALPMLAASLVVSTEGRTSSAFAVPLLTHHPWLFRRRVTPLSRDWVKQGCARQWGHSGSQGTFFWAWVELSVPEEPTGQEFFFNQNLFCTNGNFGNFLPGTCWQYLKSLLVVTLLVWNEELYFRFSYCIKTLHLKKKKKTVWSIPHLLIEFGARSKMARIQGRNPRYII